MKPRVNLLIPNNLFLRKKVGIYCRVSTKSDAQLHSISEFRLQRCSGHKGFCVEIWGGDEK